MTVFDGTDPMSRPDDRFGFPQTKHGFQPAFEIEPPSSSGANGIITRVSAVFPAASSAPTWHVLPPLGGRLLLSDYRFVSADGRRRPVRRVFQTGASRVFIGGCRRGHNSATICC